MSLQRTMMEASTGPFITHQMAALSFMSQQLWDNIQHEHTTFNMRPHTCVLGSLLTRCHRSAAAAPPRRSRTRWAPLVQTNTSSLTAEFDKMRIRSWCVMSHPSRWWCTSRSISSRGRRSPPAAWRGTGPRWRARSSWRGRSSGRISSPLDTPASETETTRGELVWASGLRGVSWEVSHRVDEAVLAVLFGVQHAVFDEDRDGPQDEGHKQVHVDEVPGAVQLPEDNHTNGLFHF